MAQSDGWVAECVSSDHTVVPDLSAWVEAAPPVQAESYESDTFADPFAEPFGTATFSAASTADVETDSGSAFGKVLVAAVVLAVIATGGVLGWPMISSFFEEPEVNPPTLAISSEPTQRLVVSGGTIYLEGSVPDESTSRFFEEAAQGALGTERVINNFEISDQAVFDPSQPVLLSVAETVLFSTGQARVNEEYRPLIELAVELMNSRQKTILRIVGHTDDRGPEEVNLQLSLERANAVAAEIERRGVEGHRLTVDGLGESEPIMTNDTQEGRSANRRVEFLISGLLD